MRRTKRDFHSIFLHLHCFDFGVCKESLWRNLFRKCRFDSLKKLIYWFFKRLQLFVHIFPTHWIDWIVIININITHTIESHILCKFLLNVLYLDLEPFFKCQILCKINTLVTFFPDQVQRVFPQLKASNCAPVIGFSGVSRPPSAGGKRPLNSIRENHQGRKVLIKMKVWASREWRRWRHELITGFWTQGPLGNLDKMENSWLKLNWIYIFFYFHDYPVKKFNSRIYAYML